MPVRPRIGRDQHARNPCGSASSRYLTQRRSVAMSSATISVSRYAADPQEPASSPMADPSTALEYARGSEGAAPWCKVWAAASSSRMEQRLSGMSSSSAVVTAVSTSGSVAPNAISSRTVVCRRRSPRLSRWLRSNPGARAVVAPESMSRLQLVADPAHGAQPARMGRIGLELVPQPMHVFGHRRLALPLRPAAPHLVQQLRPAEHMARMANQERQQVELAGGQLDGPAVDADFSRGRVHDQAAEFRG